MVRCGGVRRTGDCAASPGASALAAAPDEPSLSAADVTLGPRRNRGETRTIESDLPQSDVRIRDVEDSDVELFFEHQLDPEATRMAAFPSRARGSFMAPWAKIWADRTVLAQTIVADG
jgi:hypothetical protein